jgi:hypothetical protein
MALLWLAPFAFVGIYVLIVLLLHRIIPHRLGLPSIDSITTATLNEVIASPLWVGLGYLFTSVFGGTVLVQLIKLFSDSKLLRRKIVISTSASEIENIASGRPTEEELSDVKGASGLSWFRSFLIDLGLVLALNIAYTLLIQRYFQDFFGSAAATGTLPISHFLLSTKIILPEYLLAILFLPLLTIVAPLLKGQIKIRQIDNSTLQYYWLGLVYSISGGFSLAMFVVNIVQEQTGPKNFFFASLFIYAILSWYTALGINIAIPSAERKLAIELLKLRKQDNVYFGKIFVGKSKEELTEV